MPNKRKTTVRSKHPFRLEWVEARTLTPNPLNWRRHPDGQLSALRGVLRDDEVGWAGALLYNERTKRLIDGHGRLSLCGPSEVVPVLVGSWSPLAEKKILATLDPIGEMAHADADMLERLIGSVHLDGDDFAALARDLDVVLEDAALPQVPPSPPQRPEPKKKPEPQPPPPAKEEFKIVVTCRDRQHRRQLLSELRGEGVECRPL